MKVGFPCTGPPHLLQPSPVPAPSEPQRGIAPAASWNSKPGIKWRWKSSKFGLMISSDLFVILNNYLSCGLIDQSRLVWLLCHHLGKQGRDGTSISQIPVHGKSHSQDDNQTPFSQRCGEWRKSVKKSRQWQKKHIFIHIQINKLHYVPFDGVQSHMEEPPGASPDHAKPQPCQQAAEPGEAEQPYSPKHTKAHCNTAHQTHSIICGNTNCDFMHQNITFRSYYSLLRGGLPVQEFRNSLLYQK